MRTGVQERGLADHAVDHGSFDDTLVVDDDETAPGNGHGLHCDRRAVRSLVLERDVRRGGFRRRRLLFRRCRRLFVRRLSRRCGFFWRRRPIVRRERQVGGCLCVPSEYTVRVRARRKSVGIGPRDVELDRFSAVRKNRNDFDLQDVAGDAIGYSRRRLFVALVSDLRRDGEIRPCLDLLGG